MGQHKNKAKSQVPKASQPGANKPLTLIDRVRRLELSLTKMEDFATRVAAAFNQSMGQTNAAHQKIGTLWQLIGEQEVRNFVSFEALKAANERINLVSILALKIAGKEKMSEMEEHNLLELLTQQSPVIGEDGVPQNNEDGSPKMETAAKLFDLMGYVNMRLEEYYAVSTVCAFIRWAGTPTTAKVPATAQPAAPASVVVGDKPRMEVLKQGSEQARPQTTARFSATRGGLYLPEEKPDAHGGNESNKEGTGV